MIGRSLYNLDENWEPKDMQAGEPRFRVFGARKGFELAFLISVGIHLLVLCAVLIERTFLEEPEYKPLNVKLQADGSDKEQLEQLLSQALYPSEAEQVNDASLAAAKDKNNQKHLLENDKTSELDSKQLKQAAEDNQKAKQGESQKKQGVKKAAKPSPKSRPQPKAQPQKKSAQQKKPLGNSTEQSAEALMRYEQLLPLWLNRFRTYPPMARRLGLEGEGVVFLRIDREGKVLYASIARSTGHQILDDALLSMVAAANPVIPVPADYNKDSKEFSYQIAFRFKLDEEMQIPVYQ